MCSDFVQMIWVDPAGTQASGIGLLEDVSPAGLCVSLDTPIPVGRIVQLHTKGFSGEAEVCHCELGDYGYLVGLEFANGYGWEPEKWRPKHLLGTL